MSQSKVKQARLRAFRSQNGNCFYCELPMLPAAQEGPSSLLCTAEHLLARCDGGSDSPRNIVAACRHCNSRRHARARPLSAELFKAHVKKRVAAGKWHPAEARRVAQEVAARPAPVTVTLQGSLELQTPVASRLYRVIAGQHVKRSSGMAGCIPSMDS